MSVDETPTGTVPPVDDAPGPWHPAPAPAMTPGAAPVGGPAAEADRPSWRRGPGGTVPRGRAGPTAAPPPSVPGSAGRPAGSVPPTAPSAAGRGDGAAIGPATTTYGSPRPAAGGAAGAPAASAPGGRRARLVVRKIEPVSVFRFAFVFSLALLIISVVAVAITFLVLQALGVFDSLISFSGEVFGSGSTQVNGLAKVLSFRTVVGWTAVLGVINVVGFTLLAVLSAFFYNVVTGLVGGVEVTLAERD